MKGLLESRKPREAGGDALSLCPLPAPPGFAQRLCVAVGTPQQHCGSPLAQEELCDIPQTMCFVVTQPLPGDSGWELQITPTLCDPISPTLAPVGVPGFCCPVMICGGNNPGCGLALPPPPGKGSIPAPHSHPNLSVCSRQHFRFAPRRKKKQQTNQMKKTPPKQQKHLHKQIFR